MKNDFSNSFYYYIKQWEVDIFCFLSLIKYQHRKWKFSTHLIQSLIIVKFCPPSWNETAKVLVDVAVDVFICDGRKH